SASSPSAGFSGILSLNTIRLSRRNRSIVALRPVRISQAVGSAGTPFAGQRSTARMQASWKASSAISRSENCRVRAARTRGRATARCAASSPVAGTGLICLVLFGDCAAAPAYRAHFIGGDALRQFLRLFDRIVHARTFENIEAEQLLLCFRERAVQHENAVPAFPDGHRGRCFHQLRHRAQRSLLAMLGLKLPVVVHGRILFVLRQTFEETLIGVDQNCVLHDLLPAQLSYPVRTRRHKSDITHRLDAPSAKKQPEETRQMTFRSRLAAD
ncbi:MAG: hypothetical protein MI923_17860, partial [Phycisphaerales bacterium]|nr:hypothetical protein [Phycisphaerales bacterium]